MPYPEEAPTLPERCNVPLPNTRPPVDCQRCGEPHVTRYGYRACKAHRTDGGGCKRDPIQGGEVCATHGGASPAAKHSAAMNLASHEAAKVLQTLGVSYDTSPTEALLNEVKWSAGHVQWLREKVSALSDNDLTWQMTTESEKGATPNPGTDTTYAAKPSVWYELYCQERDRLARLCVSAITAGVEERRVRLAEQQGDLVATVIRRILNDLELSESQEAAVSTVVPRHLRMIAGGA